MKNELSTVEITIYLEIFYIGVTSVLKKRRGDVYKI